MVALQTWSTLVAAASTQAQAASSSLLNFSVGSRLRVLLEAASSIGLWLQYLLLQVLSLTRLATSTGTDADSWVADFGFTRLGAVAATGAVTLTSFSPGSQSATIPNGALVRTSDGSVTFAVTGGPYVRPVGVPSITVPVQCTTPGLAGNVASGLVNVLGTAIAGIDTCNNPSAFTNGLASETDAAMRIRFVQYINTRSQATIAAIQEAVASVQTGIFFQVVSGQDVNGNFLAGNIVVFVDDGTGQPPASLITSVDNAVGAVVADGITHQSIAANDLLANIGMTLVTSSTTSQADHATIAAETVQAVIAYLEGLNVGQSASYTRIAALPYSVDSRVTNVTGVTLNGGTSDIGGATGQVVRPGNITAS